MNAIGEGTYRSVCGRLLHRRVDAAGSSWESEDEDGTRRSVDLAATARPVLLSDDPAWPSGIGGPLEPVLDPD